MPPLPTPPPFNATVESLDGHFRVRLTGELDLATAGQAEAAVAEARSHGAGPLELDLSELTFVDSSGLRLIMQIDSACRADGCALSIVPGPRGVQRVFDVAGVLGILPFQGDPLDSDA
jgi:anti-anti-sigma factor